MLVDERALRWARRSSTRGSTSASGRGPVAVGGQLLELQGLAGVLRRGVPAAATASTRRATRRCALAAVEAFLGPGRPGAARRRSGPRRVRRRELARPARGGAAQPDRADRRRAQPGGRRRADRRARGRVQLRPAGRGRGDARRQGRDRACSRSSSRSSTTSSSRRTARRARCRRWSWPRSPRRSSARIASR